MRTSLDSDFELCYPILHSRQIGLAHLIACYFKEKHHEENLVIKVARCRIGAGARAGRWL
jgi:hypothetical protein